MDYEDDETFSASEVLNNVVLPLWSFAVAALGGALRIEGVGTKMGFDATVKLSAQPNAGRPREIEGRNIYLCSPEYMASYAKRFISNGVHLVGGCCGTTPAQIVAR